MPTLRILIIDDQPTILMLVHALLERTFSGGVEVLTAQSAEHGLNLLQQQPYDLVLTDVNMPGQDGFFVLAQAKRLSPGLPVVLMSGNPMADEAEAKGADAFLLKPFNLQEFQSTLMDVLTNGRQPVRRVAPSRGISRI
jgi:CheY-like chemotaxis protein